jgi:hypothetical protein
MRIVAVTFVGIAALLCSCMGPVITVDGITIYEKIWSDTVQTLTTRAKFDLNCQEQPDLTLIERRWRHPSVVGVRACGLSGTYIRTIDLSGDVAVAGPWVLNTAAVSEDSNQTR